MISNVKTESFNIKTHKPAIRVFQGKEMSLNKKLLVVLGRPNYIWFLYSPSEQVLLIGSTPEETRESIFIADSYYSSKTGFKIRNEKFFKVLLAHIGWNSTGVYRCFGEYLPELNMVAFKLREAEEM
jgi:hypothetical protein